MVTVVLALGMRLMAKRNAIVRRLVAVETLGSATSSAQQDGTLTMNEMTVRRVYVDGRFVDVSGEGYVPVGEFASDGTQVASDESSTLGLLLRTGALCNESSLVKKGEDYEIVGDPTEAALVVAAAKAGITRSRYSIGCAAPARYHSRASNSTWRWGIEEDEHARVYVKGSVERLLSFCDTVRKDGTDVPLDDNEREAIVKATETLAADAMRVIALATSTSRHHRTN